MVRKGRMNTLGMGEMGQSRKDELTSYLVVTGVTSRDTEEVLPAIEISSKFLDKRLKPSVVRTLQSGECREGSQSALQNPRGSRLQLQESEGGRPEAEIGLLVGTQDAWELDPGVPGQTSLCSDLLVSFRSISA